MSKELVYKTLSDSKEPLKGGEIAEISGVDAKEVSKAIKELVKEGKVSSPKRCYYSVV